MRIEEVFRNTSSQQITASQAAWHYSSGFYLWKHVNAHHVARYDQTDPPRQCTNVFFPQTKEGGVVISDNRDV